jgi:hypothetical protein
MGPETIFLRLLQQTLHFQVIFSNGCGSIFKYGMSSMQTSLKKKYQLVLFRAILYLMLNTKKYVKSIKYFKISAR